MVTATVEAAKRCCESATAKEAVASAGDVDSHCDGDDDGESDRYRYRYRYLLAITAILSIVMPPQ